MSEHGLSLAGEFEAPSEAAWLAAVDKVLKGADFTKTLVSRTYDGITIQPLYRRDQRPDVEPIGLPGEAPFVRGASATRARERPWHIAQLYAHPSAKALNAALLDDLENGVSAIELAVDQAGRQGLDAEAAGDALGDGGLIVQTIDDLDGALSNVMLDLAPLGLNAGAAGVPVAAMLLALIERRALDDSQVQARLGVNPLGGLARDGKALGGIDDALRRAGDLAAHVAARYAQVTTFAVDTERYHAAGASEAQELAAALATGVAYLRAMEAAGLGIDTACRQIAFTLAVDADLFSSIAKLRAARRLWARVAEACGASEPARAMRVHARAATRMYTKRDPWVNMLRGTAAVFAGGLGGAESVTLMPFNAALGVPDDFARRIARNTQLILQEESALGHVLDPAGGGYYFESLTDELCGRAWHLFQDIEADGGMATVLQNGYLAGKIEAVWQERAKALAKRKEAITGVSEFPNLAEEPVETAALDLHALRAGAVNRIKAHKLQRSAAFALEAMNGKEGVDWIKALIVADDAGASIGQLASAMGASVTTATPLPRHRLAEAFEHLRDLSDAAQAQTGDRPAVFLANLGPLAAFNVRATYARNFFEAGGILARDTGGFDDPASLAQAFAASGARIACICSSDAVYVDQAASAASALKSAGAACVFLAGRPGEHETAWREAGVDAFIHQGVDVLERLRQAYAAIGVELPA
ncbi:MAG: methylmalonyl-CoA mutase family protein [Geminicoccaceae bacterium]